jgi:hypothetical protein
MKSPFAQEWYIDSNPTPINFCKERIKTNNDNRYSELESCAKLTHMDSVYYVFDTTIAEKKHIYNEERVKVPFSRLSLTAKHKGIIVCLLPIDSTSGKEFLGYIEDYQSADILQETWLLSYPKHLRKATLSDF